MEQETGFKNIPFDEIHAILRTICIFAYLDFQRVHYPRVELQLFMDFGNRFQDNKICLPILCKNGVESLLSISVMKLNISNQNNVK